MTPEEIDIAARTLAWICNRETDDEHEKWFGEGDCYSERDWDELFIESQRSRWRQLAIRLKAIL